MATKAGFVRELAKFLVDGQAGKSIKLEMGQPEARQWAALRGTTPLMGYPSQAEAEKQLAQWLGFPEPSPEPK